MSDEDWSAKKMFQGLIALIVIAIVGFIGFVVVTSIMQGLVMM